MNEPMNHLLYQLMRKESSCGLLASRQLLVDRVGPGMTEEVHILHFITQTFRLIAIWFVSGVPEIFIV